MKYQPIIKNGVMIFNLHKPIYNSTYAIWDKWLKKAKSLNLKLVINTPDGTAIFESVSEYLKVSQPIKRFFKNPNEPMIFYKIDILPFVKKREERKKLEKKLEETDGQLMIKWLQELKEKKLEEFSELKEQLSLL